MGKSVTGETVQKFCQSRVMRTIAISSIAIRNLADNHSRIKEDEGPLSLSASPKNPARWTNVKTFHAYDRSSAESGLDIETF
ncbi:hypothetical protein AVEN_225270-1 [Araneus ventricosus]|uniref:Uncharacterized protein n=1 Tax=Araneus ventricosus TaxID=182803 RepID=A0A4Y2ANK9_ARAVE|nr:hypothetical protein AVEN_225270-1 [Araneus ventricosus]